MEKCPLRCKKAANVGVRTIQVGLRALPSCFFRLLCPCVSSSCELARVDSRFPGLVFRKIFIEDVAVKVKCTDMEP